jgi:hypothetical protein
MAEAYERGLIVWTSHWKIADSREIVDDRSDLVAARPRTVPQADHEPIDRALRHRSSASKATPRGPRRWSRSDGERPGEVPDPGASD